MSKTLTIRKKSALTWLHVPSDQFNFIIGKFTFSIDGEYFLIIRPGQSKSNKYHYSDITVINDITDDTYTGFSSITALCLQLEALEYIGFTTVGIMEAPIDGETYGRENASWQIVSGGSGTNQLTKVVFEDTDITVPSGFSGAVINLNNTNSEVTYTVTGTLMTITGGADNGDVLIF